MRMIFLGAPGSGKGTQGKMVAETFGITSISTGDLLRQAVAEGSTLGKNAKKIMEAGLLVPDEIVFEMIEQRLQESDVEKGFILDGFPRNLEQAEGLQLLLTKINKPLLTCILFDVHVDELIQRLSGRRTCADCGQVFNIFTSPSKLEAHCDRCGGDLTQRSDDNEETIGHRLKVYENHTKPLIDYYQEQKLLFSIDAGQSVETIQATLLEHLNSLKAAA